LLSSQVQTPNAMLFVPLSSILWLLHICRNIALF